MNEDNHSLLEWLRGKELEEHTKTCVPCPSSGICNRSIKGVCKEVKIEEAFREVITHIENNPKELHRCLIPAGWEEV
jgi:hypothetical protein